MSHKLSVLITVDTETGAPLGPHWYESGLAAEMRRDIDGETAQGDFGLQYQLDTLNRHGLRATFFVEALFASAVGVAPLARIVGQIDDAGHDVQLHLHPEWLRRMPHSVLPGRAGRNMTDFAEDEQQRLIAIGLENLSAAGARRIHAFRAGNFGAGFSTLAALRKSGLLYDSSYNAVYVGNPCGLATPSLLLQPAALDGVIEFPVGCFEDWSGRLRPLQFCACSENELEWMLWEAWRRRWRYLVVVSHSFEFLQRPRRMNGRSRPDRRVIERFERFCRVLAENRASFTTTVFSDVDPTHISAQRQSSSAETPVRSSLPRTAGRYVEQLLGRFGC